MMIGVLYNHPIKLFYSVFFNLSDLSDKILIQTVSSLLHI